MSSGGNASQGVQDVRVVHVSLTLPLHQQEVAFRTSRFFSRIYSTEFVLGSDSLCPHIPLCTMAFPFQALSLVQEAVIGLLRGRKRIQCTPLVATARERYVGMQIQLTDEIRILHATLLSVLAPLRANEGGEQCNSLTPRQMEYMQRYGYPYAFELYDPHFTLTRLKRQDDTEKAVSHVHWPMEAFPSSSVGIYIAADHGVCAEKIMEFPFMTKR